MIKLSNEIISTVCLRRKLYDFLPNCTLFLCLLCYQTILTYSVYSDLFFVFSFAQIRSSFCIFFLLLNKILKRKQDKDVITKLKFKHYLESFGVTLHIRKNRPNKIINNNTITRRVRYRLFYNRACPVPALRMLSSLLRKTEEKCLWRGEYPDQAFCVFLPRNYIICCYHVMSFDVKIANNVSYL